VTGGDSGVRGDGGSDDRGAVVIVMTGDSGDSHR
jgi:hypothetical protein